MFSNTSSGVDVATGNGNGTFGALTHYTGTIGLKGLTTGDVNGDGATDLIGAAYSSAAIEVFLGNTTSKIEIPAANVSMQSDAQSALDMLSRLQEKIGRETGTVGAQMSRLELAASSLQRSYVNYEASASRISDVDVAESSAALVGAQILQQAASTVLSQANQQPALALQFLRA